MPDRIVTVGLFCLFLGWNLPNHYPPWPSFYLELATALGAILLLAVNFWQRPFTAEVPQTMPGAASNVMPLSSAARVAMLLAVIPPLQYAAGVLSFRADAALGALYLLGLALTIYAGQLWAGRRGSRDVVTRLMLTVLAGGIVANALALVQWLRLDAPGWWAVPLFDARPFGNFAQPNHFGLMMVLGIVASAALFELRVVRSRPVFYLLLAYFGWGILISQSRASALALYGVVFLWLLTHKRLPTRLLLGEVLVGAALWLLMFQGLESLQTAMQLRQDEFKNPMEIGVRPIMWRQFLAAVLHHPWLGYGFNQGALALSEVVTLAPPSGVTTASIYAHDLALDLMVWFGIPCGLAVTVGVGVWMLRWLRVDASSSSMSLRHLVFATCLALALQSLVEYPYAYAYFLLPAGLLAGAISAPAVKEGAAHVQHRCSRVALLLLPLVGALFVAIAGDYWQLEEDYRVLRFARSNYVNQPQHDYLEDPLLLDHLALLNKTARYRLTNHMTSQQLDDMRRVSRRFHNTVLQLDYAKALALNGQLSVAEHELLLMRSMYESRGYKSIEQQWQEWLARNPGVAPGRS